jgi:hypothetical protein
MGYLNNSTITVDAILTKKGRELLAQGKGLNITKFAIADDEVNYGLYTTSHPLGSNFYGAIIENTPLVEASPDETQVMRYKLVSLPRGTKEIPRISVGFDTLTLQYSQIAALPIRPTTSQGLNGPGFGYTAILHNSDAAVLVGTGLSDLANASAPAFLGDISSGNSAVASGLEFTLSPKDVAAQIITSITFIGNETGATITVPLTVTPKPTV